MPTKNETLREWLEKTAEELEDLNPAGMILLARLPGGKFVIRRVNCGEMACAMAAGALMHAAAVEESWERMLLHETAAKPE